MDHPETKEADAPQGHAVTRRSALKLAAGVAALGAGLSVTFDQAEADADAPLAALSRQEQKEPGRAARLELKFYQLPSDHNDANARLVASIPIIPDSTERILSVPQGLLQFKIFLANYKEQPLSLNTQQIKWDTSRVDIKRALEDLTVGRRRS